MVGSDAGICEKHKMYKMFVGTEDNLVPTCIKCKAEGEPKSGLVSTTEDPGDEYFSSGQTTAKAKIQKVNNTSLPNKAPQRTTLSNSVTNALEWLNLAPMPKDLKQFKALQKTIKILENLLESPK